MRRAIALTLITAVCGLSASLLQKAPPSASSRSSPLLDDPDARLAGKKLYVRECASCHGPDRQGGKKTPPLGVAAIRRASPGALFWVLRNGSRRGMPFFAHLPEAQRWEIVSYLVHE